MSFEFTNSSERKEIMEKELQRWCEFILKNIGLSVDDLKGKKILDIGAGERFIAGYCAKEGVNNEIYSVEPNIDNAEFVKNFIGKNWPEIKTEIDKKTVKNRQEELPYKDESFDLAINSFALPGKRFFKEGKIDDMKNSIDSALQEITRVLKPGGEARIYPLEFYADDQGEQFRPWKEAVENKLNELKSSGHYQVVLEKVNVPKRKIETTRIIIIKNEY